jgi:hypothetical protein
MSTPITRPIHLGIDYGTSTSKLVLRDYAFPGGERAVLIGERNNYLFPSIVSCSADKIFLGVKPSGGLVRGEKATGYESVKMRVAEEVKNAPGRYYYGPQSDFPTGFQAADLATLSVWSLISAGEKAAREGLKISNIRLGMTLGIPMSFFADSELREAFLMIARAAWQLYRTHGPIAGDTLNLADARNWLDEAQKAVRSKDAVSPAQVRDWIRSEAEAAMLWAFRSPGVPSGPYLKVDVGAGTTNASMFRIIESFTDGRWVKSGFAFFGTYSGPHGMDAIDHALATHLSIDINNCLELRSHEDRLLHDAAALSAVQQSFRQVRDSEVQAWRRGYSKIMTSPFEVQNWGQANVFVIGGGSLVSPLRNFLSAHPNGQNIELPQRQPDMPSDLYPENGTSISATLLPFVNVAYGLSNLGLAVPEAETPDTIPNMAALTTLQRLQHEDIYGE